MCICGGDGVWTNPRCYFPSSVRACRLQSPHHIVSGSAVPSASRPAARLLRWWQMFTGDRMQFCTLWHRRMRVWDSEGGSILWQHVCSPDFSFRQWCHPAEDKGLISVCLCRCVVPTRIGISGAFCAREELFLNKNASLYLKSWQPKRAFYKSYAFLNWNGKNASVNDLGLSIVNFYYM